MKRKRKEWARRALRTFFQTAVGYLVAAVPFIDYGQEKSAIKTALVGIAVSAIAAGIAAAMNLNEGGGSNG